MPKRFLLSRGAASWLERAALAVACAAVCSLAHAEPDDGRRAVTVERYGIAVRVPQAWRLVNWGADQQAFVLRLPQEEGSPVGYVSCELGVAPEHLHDFQQRQQAAEEARQVEGGEPASKLLFNDFLDLDASGLPPEQREKLAGKRLVSVWEHRDETGLRWFEQRVRVISDGTLYTFILASDEAHYEAYRLDFEDMFRSARFSAPHTGLARLPRGYWMQREFRFALRLPAEWKPAFGPDDRVLFFATGAPHEAFTDNLLVLASQPRELNLAELQRTLPETIRRADNFAEVAQCEIKPQGNGEALETVVHTRRGGLKVTILERRFAGAERSYEVKCTCESEQFLKIEEQLRQALDSFLELPPATDQPAVL